MKSLLSGAVQPLSPGQAQAPQALGHAAGYAPPARTAPGWQLGEWTVRPDSLRLERPGQVDVALEPRQMAVLCALCEAPGQVLSTDDLLDRCWPADGLLGDNPVRKTMALLRRALGDSATTPRYIETIRTRGYRLLQTPLRLSPATPTDATDTPDASAPAWAQGSPFPGLMPFGEHQAAVFFGRDTALQMLREQLHLQWQRGHAQVVLLGPSGSGKTSLVQAGLIPALRHAVPPGLLISSATVLDLGDGGPLWDNLAAALLDWEAEDQALLAGYSAEQLAALLRDSPEALPTLLPTKLPPPLLVLDRLEALLGEPEPAELLPLLTRLDQWARSGRMLQVLICRNDYYPALARHPELMHGKGQGQHVDLLPPQAAELLQMIRLPARAAGLDFEAGHDGQPALDEQLCHDAMQTPDAMPLLQYTLQQLYQQRSAEQQLLWSAYQALGGLSGAISHAAEAVFNTLPAAQQQALDPLLSRLVLLPGNNQPPTGRRSPLADITQPDELALVQALVQARLLVTDWDNAQPGLRVAHDALLRRWPRVSDWISRHRDALAFKTKLLPLMQRWQDNQQPSEYLLPSGPTLTQAGETLKLVGTVFTTSEQHFIRLSMRQAQRREWLRWLAWGSVTSLALVSSVLAWQAHRAEQRVREQGAQREHILHFMLGDLANKLRPLGRLDVLDDVGQQALAVLSQSDPLEDSHSASLQQAQALLVVGEVAYNKGDPSTASLTFEKAQTRLDDSGADPAAPSVPLLKAQGQAAFWLGQLAFDAGDMARAQAQFVRYRQASQRWLDMAPQDPQARMELGYAENSLGSVALHTQQWEAAAQAFRTSIAHKQQVIAAQPQTETATRLADLADSWSWLGTVDQARGALQAALDSYQEQTRLLQEVAQRHPQDMLWQRRLSLAWTMRMEVLRDLGQTAAAWQAGQRALQLASLAVTHEPDNWTWRLGWWRIQAELAVLALYHPQWDHTGQAAAQLQQLQQTLANAQPAHRARSQRLLALVEHGLAVAAWRQRRADAVRQHQQQADRMLTTLRQQHRGDWQASDLQARNDLLQLAWLSEYAQDPASRQAICHTLIQRHQPAVQQGQYGVMLAVWLHAQHCAGIFPADWHQHKERLNHSGYRWVSTAVMLAPLP